MACRPIWRRSVVTIAVLDAASARKIPVGKIASLAAMLGDSLPASTGVPGVIPPNPQLPAQVWQNTLNSAGLATTLGIPQPVLAQVRVYQRIIYLDKN